jgi:glutaredoxin
LSKSDKQLANHYIGTATNNTRNLGIRRALQAYKLQGPVQRNVPELFIKRAEWWVVNSIEQYHTKSSAPEESGEPEHAGTQLSSIPNIFVGWKSAGLKI